MKKFVLILSLFTVVMAYSQKTWVTGTAKVYVAPKTLFYHGSGLEVKDNTALFKNKGNTKVWGGDFKVANNASNNQFQSLYTDNGGTSTNGVPATTGYGQLIVKNGIAVAGNSMIQRGIGLSSTFTTYVQSGFPFQTLTAANLATYSGYTFADAARATHTLFVWNNAKIQWDRVMAADVLSAEKYYIVKNAAGYAGYNAATTIDHKGPVNNLNATVAFGVVGASGIPTGDISALTRRNEYNERYITYVDDPFQSTKTATDWGRNMVQLGNPYTSNIDLSYIGLSETATVNGVALNDGNAISNIKGVYKYSGNVQTSSTTAYNYSTSHYSAITSDPGASGQFVAGDANILLVRPYEGFIIKLDNNTATNFSFNDGLKTFNYNARVKDNAAGTGTSAYRTGGNAFYQVAMTLLKDNTTALNTAYVVANNNVTNGYGGALEAELLDLSSNTGIYTKQEVATGTGEDAAYTGIKYLINQVNTSYLGTPIPVHFQVNAADAGSTFKIVFNLDETLRRLDATTETNFSNSAARYYFRDNQTNQVFLINAGTEYTFTQSASTGERFQLFYGEPSTMGNEEIPNDLANSTVVYETEDSSHAIRFNPSWNKANVAVYTAVGQVVYTKKDINAENDFVLPLNNANTTVYVIQIENAETHEVITKKIVK